MRVYDLRCQQRTGPIDLDTPTPMLGWKLADDDNAKRQTAYEIVAASTPAVLDSSPDLWQSGRVESDQTLQVVYGGAPLDAFRVVHWKVRVWDEAGVASDWSDAATFATGPLTADDWPGGWIGAPESPESPDALPLFRRTFAITKPFARATIYICGLGQFELRCNGRRVSEDLLQPGWTNYRKTCQAVAHDLTPYLAAGENALGVMLGHGMYHVGDAPPGTKRYTKFKASFGPPVLIAQLRIEYADGTSDTVVTDPTWRTATGPITFSNIYGGEDYDARRERPGWDTPAFDASAWHFAEPRTGPGGALRGSSQAAPPVRIARVFDAVLKSEPSPGLFVYDAGQNCSMMPRLVIRGPAGSTVKIYPGESLTDDGRVNQKHTGSPVFYGYTLRGDGEESWSPRFSYTGGRYMQIKGATPPDRPAAGVPVLLSLQSQHLTSTSPTVGRFECSSEMFTRTAGLIDWAIASNAVSVLTDCPHREKLGWTEEQHLMGPSLMYARDLGPLYRKITADHTDAQLPTGDVPTICPQYTQFKPPWDVFNDSPEWGSAAVLVPWQVYRWYGDVALLRRQYPTMKRYVDYLTSRATGGIVRHGLGDWYDLGPNPPGFTQLTPKELTATAIYFHDAGVLSQAATRLGFDDDAAAYASLATEIRTAFNRTFFDARASTYATGSQTSLAMPLALGLVEATDRDAVLARLIADIAAHGWALTSGDVGYRYLLRALADAGRSDVVYAMNARSDRPGYGMMIARGETSLTEAWDARPQSSLNHFMLGHIQEWFYADLVGLTQADDSVAFSHVLVRPNPVGGMTRARATYDSVRGPIEVAWSIVGGELSVDCVFPPNVIATVRLPTTGGPVVHHVGSGRHRFSGPIA